jgi:pilus assembly protein Flp/PilA
MSPFDTRSATDLASLGKGDAEMKGWIRSFLRDDEGATALEYGAMLALIIVVALGAVNALGTKVSATYANVTTLLP